MSLNVSLNSNPLSSLDISKTDELNPLQQAVKQNNIDKISQLLFQETFSEENLLQVLIFAHDLHYDQAIKTILNHVSLNANKRSYLFTKGIELFDKSGNNLALEWAKKLEENLLRKEIIDSIEKKLVEKSNQEYSKHFQKQLNLIQNQIQQALKKNEKSCDQSCINNFDWWENQESIEKATVAAQLKVIPEKMKEKESLTVAFAGSKNGCLSAICQNLINAKIIPIDQIANGSLDLLLAPHSLYKEMESIFKSSEDLLLNRSSVKDHPLFKYFNLLNENGFFIVTMNSGPNIKDFTNLILGKHELQLNKANTVTDSKLTIFNNVETFFRCLDIFQRFYKEKTGKVIDCQVSYSIPRISLEQFCEAYLEQYPELATMNPDKRETFIRLLSVFNIGDELVDLNMTLQMSVKEETDNFSRSFKPICMDMIDLASTKTKSESNDISMGQQNLERQLQSLNGSDISMPYIKEADGVVQFKALNSVLCKKELNFVEIGGGRGETNAVLKAIQDNGTTIHLLNFDPETRYVKPYTEAHEAIGIKDVKVVLQGGQVVSPNDITSHFNGKKADVVFASHSFYFFINSLHKASHSSIPLTQHPLYKYFDMMTDEGTFVLTMQTGAGARLFRNALLGNHGLNSPTSYVTDETLALLGSFGNIGTVLRHFEVFTKQYEKTTGKKINIKMHYAVANVPLGDFKIKRDAETGGYIIHSPEGDDKDPNWLSPIMLDFYGNWKELQMLSTLTIEKVKEMKIEERKKIGLENFTSEMIIEKREKAQKMQETFLNILHFFAPGEKNMQHPNITLEITVLK